MRFSRRRRPGEGRDPYSAAAVTNGTRRSSVAKDDPRLDGTLPRTAAKHVPIIE
jgi:hypothetical protein